MSAAIPLPETVCSKIHGNTHPGLQLDKFAVSWLQGKEDKLQEIVQKETIQKVVKLSQGPPAGLEFESLCRRRNKILANMKAEQFVGITTGPLTLHLSRASALENAGICLHPLYGFAYLPGSGIKGMARAYAETVWKPAHENTAAADKQIQAVFGNVPGAEKSFSGSVVFHDAWPNKWPRLQLDIVNNHHQGYYSGSNPPGDWEDPIPVYFLAIESGTEFVFHLSLRRQDDDATAVADAKEWLLGALCHLGAGAKTNAGYGFFKPLEKSLPDLPKEVRAVYETQIELVTPAFLAGALQHQGDCRLRSATIRGLLRWWWRTLHVGHLDEKSLRSLEALVWGDVERAGAVRVSVADGNRPEPIEYKHKDRFRPKEHFQKEHDLQKPPFGMTQGLFYLSYGMDDAGKNSRWYMPAGSTWRMELCSKAIKNGGLDSVDPCEILEQARMALWLLCNFGGVGSKARKGFGSLTCNNLEYSLDFCKSKSALFRKKIKFDKKIDKENQYPAIDNIICQDIETQWKDCWFGLDQLGFAVQGFAKKYKHKHEKMAIGLPRKIHGPMNNPMRHQNPNNWREPIPLTCIKGSRHASPVHFHFRNDAGGNMKIIATAFPSEFLPDYKTSVVFLKEYVEFVRNELKIRTDKYKNLGQNVAKIQTRSDEKEVVISSVNETWDDAVLKLDPGSGELSARSGNNTARTRDKSIVPESIMNLLKNRRHRKPVRAAVMVESIGNRFNIVSIRGQ